MSVKELNESKRAAVKYAMNHNDCVGTQFREAILKYEVKYMTGVIHHQEFINQVAKCCEQAQAALIDVSDKDYNEYFNIE